MKKHFLYIIVLCILCMSIVTTLAHIEHTDNTIQQSSQTVRATSGESPWNQGQPPKDWWGTIKQMHGHVGPWNVLGWRIGQAALREFNSKWGRHELDIICYIPMATPYSCICDGLVIGTGNSIGRLDIRLAEVMMIDFIQVTVRRKEDTGRVLIFRPRLDYMKCIETRSVEELEELSRRCSLMKESELFHIEKTVISETNKM